MKDELETKIVAVVQDLFAADAAIELARPEEQFGDYSTNVALQLSKKIGQKPREIGEALAVKLRETLSDKVANVSVAGPGFVNITLRDASLIQSLNAEPAKSLAGKVIVAEYSDPNPFKVLHAGHLYTSLVGDSVARLMEQGGATVHRVNFGGDVGLHVGITMWAIIQKLGGENPSKLDEIPEQDRLEWLSQRYVEGNTDYEQGAAAQTEIVEVNQRVYQLHADSDHDSPFAQIYWTCRQWSYEGFNSLYEQLQMVPFEKYYPESEVGGLGLKTVKEHTGPVYEESDGAVIYRGEQQGLFTQVFINSEGLPTYAAKDVGLIFHKQADFQPDRSFIITDHAQKDHLAVVMASINQFAPELVAVTTHYAHGQIKMAGGVKMSSRLGNIIRAEDILESARKANAAAGHHESEDTILGAVRYAFIKNRIGSDIVYDPAESVSLEGNSGPYLQYAHARARSILAKTKGQGAIEGDLQPGERTLTRKMSEYAEVVDRAVTELMPHHIATYLYELAQIFNRFYENNRVIGDNRQDLRLGLVQKYAETLKSGLGLLGISAPDRM